MDEPLTCIAEMNVRSLNKHDRALAAKRLGPSACHFNDRTQFLFQQPKQNPQKKHRRNRSNTANQIILETLIRSTARRLDWQAIRPPEWACCLLLSFAGPEQFQVDGVRQRLVTGIGWVPVVSAVIDS
jgi:hypothetical protein